MVRLEDPAVPVGSCEGLVGSSEALRGVIERIARVAPTQATVLITGESGTGKELVARAVHDGSPRKDRPFVALSCAAMPQGLLVSGMPLGAAEVAVVASAGLSEVLVSRQPAICVISTGDELVEPGEPIADHQVRRSNAYAVASSLALHGFDRVQERHLRDDETQMRRALGALLESEDVLVLSGGVSKGKFDFVPKTLQALGVTEVFYQVAQRPGRPLWFGVGPRGQLVFGLPGNPVSTLVCLVRYVLPALQAAMQRRPAVRERVALAEASSGRKMSYFMPVTRIAATPARAMVTTQPPNGSGDFLAQINTTRFIW